MRLPGPIDLAQALAAHAKIELKGHHISATPPDMPVHTVDHRRGPQGPFQPNRAMSATMIFESSHGMEAAARQIYTPPQLEPYSTRPANFREI
jgi:hypothetical protein